MSECAVLDKTFPVSPVTMSLIGTNSLWTVSKVAVQAGGSVTIPCHYHRMFQQRMKYWCKGRRWNVCRELGRTTSKPRTEGFSITDYPSEQFFTITMTNLQEKDTDRYWCAVKRSAWDSVRASMEVEVTEGRLWGYENLK